MDPLVIDDPIEFPEFSLVSLNDACQEVAIGKIFKVLTREKTKVEEIVALKEKEVKDLEKKSLNKEGKRSKSKTKKTKKKKKKSKKEN